MREDILSEVIISPRTLARWLQACVRVASRQRISPSAIGEETARPLRDGSLLLSVTLRGGGTLAVIVIPASEWEWQG